MLTTIVDHNEMNGMWVPNAKRIDVCHVFGRPVAHA